MKRKLGPRLSSMIQDLVWCSTAGSVLLKKSLLRRKKLHKSCAEEHDIRSMTTSRECISPYHLLSAIIEKDYSFTLLINILLRGSLVHDKRRSKLE